MLVGISPYQPVKVSGSRIQRARRRPLILKGISEMLSASTDELRVLVAAPY